MSLEHLSGEHTNESQWHKPEGLKYLSHSLDTVSEVMSVYQKIDLYKRAVEELKQLPGGMQAYEQAISEFVGEHNRMPGDMEAARRYDTEKASMPARPDWFDHPQFLSEYIARDMESLAYHMTHFFVGDNNPRTPEYLEQYYSTQRKFSEEMGEKLDSELFTKELRPINSEVEINEDKIHAKYKADWGASWDDIDFDSHDTESGAAMSALRLFIGYDEALKNAAREWDELKPLLDNNDIWHNFDTNKENYVVRRVNTLLGSPLQLEPYRYTMQAFTRHLNSFNIYDLDIDMVLKFIKLNEIDGADEYLYQYIQALLEDDVVFPKSISIKGQLHKSGINPHTNLEQYVRALNKSLDSPIRMK